MGKKLKAFQIRVAGKVLDYHLGKQLDLGYVRAFFKKKYSIRHLSSGGRHILGILEKDNKDLFLKLATTEGISELTKNEYLWNETFNRLVPRKTSIFWVPQNKDCGLYDNKLFYIISDWFDGELLSKNPVRSDIPKIHYDLLPNIIEFSELIQKLNINLSGGESSDYKKFFLGKTTAWYNDIPEDIKEKYSVDALLNIVQKGIFKLQKRSRHGDFTPWHLFKLRTGQLGLIDGEHAMGNGIEYYDIGYFIQRIFSVLENQDFAEEILSLLIKNGCKLDGLTVILAARGIGGFLDESLKTLPDYTLSNKFKNWIKKLI